MDTSSDLAKYEEYRKLDEDQASDMMKVGFEVIPLDKVRQNSYILVGSRYRMSEGQSKYETVSFSDIATLTRGVNYQKAQQTTFKTQNIILPADNITLAGELDVVKEIYVDETVSLAEEKRLKQNDIFICMSSGSKEHIGKVAYIDQDTNYYAGGFMGIIRTNPNKCLSKYLYFYLLASKKYREEIKLLTQGANINNISSTINSIKIPLPSIEVQHQIISELDGYRQVISGANRIVNNYKTNISINPKWNNIALGDMCEFEYGFTDTATKDGDVRYVRITDINTDGTLSNDDPKYVSLSEENRKYYDECEKLLLPFYEKMRNVYIDMLSEIEIKLDFADQIYHKGDTTALYQNIKGLYDVNDKNKYYAWALCEVYAGLKEYKKKLVTITQQEEFEKLFRSIKFQYEKIMQNCEE